MDNKISNLNRIQKCSLKCTFGAVFPFLALVAPFETGLVFTRILRSGGNWF